MHPHATPRFLPGFTEDGTPATNRTDMVASLWVNSWIVLLVVGVVTWGLMLWAMIAYRRRKGQTGLPVQLRYNMPIEIFYTVVPLILVVGFFAFTARDQTILETQTENPDVSIVAIGKQWAWDFQYNGKQKDGSDDVWSMGIQAQTAPNGRVDNAQLPTLYLPVDKTVKIKLESRDVIHSFWIIDFLYKKDMYIGQDNSWSFTPTREGTYAGKCAELCGEYHSSMLFNVKVVSEASTSSTSRICATRARPAPSLRRTTASTTCPVRVPRRTKTVNDGHHASAPEGQGRTTTLPPRQAALLSSSRVEEKGNIVVKWVTSTDHKTIGYMYLISSFLFFLLGGVMALIIRAELFEPGMQILPTKEQYNQLFTMHGTIMLLMFATPLFAGFANAILPLQIGAPDVAFPRLNAFAFWLFLFGSTIAVSGFLTPSGAASFGWFAYQPLASATFSPGVGGNLWMLGLGISGFGTILGAVNFITTVVTMRAPGMTMWRMPIFSWNVLITSILVLIAFPVLAAAILAAAPTACSVPTSTTPRTAESCSGSTCSGSSATPRCTSSRCRSSASSLRSSRSSAGSRSSDTRPSSTRRSRSRRCRSRCGPTTCT